MYPLHFYYSVHFTHTVNNPTCIDVASSAKFGTLYREVIKFPPHPDQEMPVTVVGKNLECGINKGIKLYVSASQPEMENGCQLEQKWRVCSVKEHQPTICRFHCICPVDGGCQAGLLYWNLPKSSERPELCEMKFP